jgi:hypothetical protein
MQLKKLIRFSHILSWCNLIIAALLILFALVSGLAVLGIVNALTPIVLLGSILLNSYAAIQLSRSLLNPSIPLSRQTPTGIRLLGYISLFFAFLYGGSGIAILQNSKELLKQVEIPAELKNINIEKIFRVSAIFALIFSCSIIVNVILNFRLLRWFYFLQRPDQEKKPE